MEITKPIIGGVAMQGTWQVGMVSARPAGNTAWPVHAQIEPAQPPWHACLCFSLQEQGRSH